jgi:hypothetical protein
MPDIFKCMHCWVEEHNYLVEFLEEAMIVQNYPLKWERKKRTHNAYNLCAPSREIKYRSIGSPRSPMPALVPDGCSVISKLMFIPKSCVGDSGLRML